MLPDFQGRRKGISKGGRFLNGFFQKAPFCTYLFLNTLYRKCITFATQKKGGNPPSYGPDFTSFKTPLLYVIRGPLPEVHVLPSLHLYLGAVHIFMISDGYSGIYRDRIINLTTVISLLDFKCKFHAVCIWNRINVQTLDQKQYTMVWNR